MGVKGRRWIKTRVKEAAEIKKAEIKAEATALRQVRKKQTGLEILREYIDKALAKVDPMEAVAVIGGTIIIKNGIDFTQDFVYSGKLQPFILSQLPKGLGLILTELEKLDPEQQKEEVKKVSTSAAAEIMEWIISFTLAYILIHNAGAILEATGELVGAAKNLLGIKTVVPAA